MNSDELKTLNGWSRPYIDNMTGRSPFYITDGTITYPGDQTIILNHNLDKHKPNKIITALRPEPWYGDVTNAKLIILGNMPVYEDYICRSQNLALDVRIQEQIYLYVNYWHELGMSDSWGTHYMYGYYRYPYDESIDMMDFYFSPTYHHWRKELQTLSENCNIHTNYIFGNTAIINAFPYYYQQPEARPLALGLLPSHHFLRQLIHYVIRNNPTTLIVIPSKELNNTWHSILGDLYDSYHIVKGSNINHWLSLTPYALGDGIYEGIVSRLS